MRYIDAGYVIVLGTLAAYASSLAWRRRRLEQAARRIAEGPEVGGPPPGR